MITHDLSFANTELWRGCEFETINGTLVLKTPTPKAIELLEQNFEPGDHIDEKTEVTLAGVAPPWAYMVVFYRVVHRFRRVFYDDGSGPVLVAGDHAFIISDWVKTLTAP